MEYDIEKIKDAQVSMEGHLEWALSKCRMIEPDSRGSVLNEISEVEMSLRCALVRCQDMRLEVQGHKLTIPGGK